RLAQSDSLESENPSAEQRKSVLCGLTLLELNACDRPNHLVCCEPLPTGALVDPSSKARVPHQSIFRFSRRTSCAPLVCGLHERCPKNILKLDDTLIVFHEALAITRRNVLIITIQIKEARFNLPRDVIAEESAEVQLFYDSFLN